VGDLISDFADRFETQHQLLKLVPFLHGKTWLLDMLPDAFDPVTEMTILELHKFLGRQVGF